MGADTAEFESHIGWCVRTITGRETSVDKDGFPIDSADWAGDAKEIDSFIEPNQTLSHTHFRPVIFSLFHRSALKASKTNNQR